MQPGKKYVGSDGVQYAMYPNAVMNITQSINGSYSHRGTNAIDDAQANTGISNGYAPCDMVCVATDYVNGNAMFWQSVNPVRTRNYGVTHIYMMVIHDNTANAYKGMTIGQGQQLFSEGTAGNATGNHNHIEVGIGQFKGMYVLNGYGVYMMPGNVNPADVFFVDNTQIINGGGLNWGTIPAAANPKPEDLTQEDGIATLTVDSVRARLNGPNGSEVRKYNTGDKVRYYWKWVGNGHRYVVWKEGTNYIYLAISGSETPGKDLWATFSAPEGDTGTSQPDPEPSDLTQEDGIATLTVDSVRARLNGPNGSIVRTYNTGDKVRYYWKWVGNGHRYVVWKEGNEYIYLAISGSEEQGKDLWATFSAPDDTNTDGGSESKPSTPSYDELYDPEEEPELEDDIIDVEEFAKYGLKAKVQLVDRRLYKSKCCYTMKNPKGVGIHNFGSSSGSPTAQNSADGQNKEDMNPNNLKSWHFQVDDKEIIQSLPMNRNSFSFGDGAKGEGNRNYISIEIMKDMPTDDKEAADKAQDNGALAAAIIYYTKGWDIKDLKKHQDFKMSDGSHKYCPHRILDNGWDKFMEQVQAHYDRIVEMNNPKEPDPDPEEPENPDEKPVDPVDPKPEEPEKIDNGLINALLKSLNTLVKVITKFINGLFKKNK